MGRKTEHPVLGRGRDARARGAGSFTRANALPIEDVARALGLPDDESRVRCPGCSNTDGVALVNNGLKCRQKTCSDRGVPGTPGFRTPVHLVSEARQLEAADAARWLLERFLGESPDAPRRRAPAADDDDDCGMPPPVPPPDEELPSGFIGRDFPLTDGENAERFAAHHGEDVRHCHDWKKWLVWDGTRWGSDRRAAVEFRAFQTVRAIPSEAARAPTPKKRRRSARTRPRATARAPWVRCSRWPGRAPSSRSSPRSSTSIPGHSTARTAPSICVSESFAPTRARTTSRRPH